VMAASRNAGDSAGLSDGERSRLRGLARGWLNDELRDNTKRLTGTWQDRARGVRLLTTWKLDPDLAGIRDADAVGKLSPDERTQCLTLWTGVDTLLTQFQAPEKQPADPATRP